MKYYGEPGIKLGVKVGEMAGDVFYEKNGAMEIIKEHGLLGEYVSKMTNGNGDTYEIEIDPKAGMKCVEYNNEKYWYGENYLDLDRRFRNKRAIGFYRELPDIYDDDKFQWKKNKKYGTLECVVKEDIFEYYCVYKDGNANIDVRYIACDNLHRNKVTMSRIEVIGATNDDIMRAIKRWKSNLEDKMRDN